jgi:hypothetical protein
MGAACSGALPTPRLLLPTVLVPSIRLAPATRLRHLRRWLVGSALLLLAACAGGDGGSSSTPPTAPDPTPPVPTGEVAVAVPQPVAGAQPVVVQLQPLQGGSSLAITAGDRRPLPAGTYTVNAPLVTDSRGHVWSSPQHGQQVTIGAGAVVTLTVSYHAAHRIARGAALGAALIVCHVPVPPATPRSLWRRSIHSRHAPRRLTLGDSLHGLWPGAIACVPRR